MSPLNAREAVLRPISSQALSESKEEEPLFLPAGADKIWYLGFLDHWKHFHELALQFWNSQLFESAFYEIQGHPIAGPRACITVVAIDSDGTCLLTDYFQREVLEVVDNICNRLLQTATMRGADVPERVALGIAADEDVGNDDMPWDPKYVVCAKPIGSDEETRLIGHVEYMGGRSGALTKAIVEGARNYWGSLRCILGDISKWMLMGNIRYAFLTTSDEIIFLKLDILTRVENVNRAPRGSPPEIEQVETTKEPWLYYSDPIKYTDELNEEHGTVPVRLALLYLLHTSTMSGWRLDSDLGPPMKYLGTAKAGEKWKFTPPDLTL